MKPRRESVVSIRLTPADALALSIAAARAGIAPSTLAARAVVAALTGGVPVSLPWGGIQATPVGGGTLVLSSPQWWPVNYTTGWEPERLTPTTG